MTSVTSPSPSSATPNGGKPRSLVEQKRLQWARERDEMANLCAPWGKNKHERFPMKTPYPAEYYYHRSSLPPLRKPAYRGDQGGETSGYASDVVPQQTDVWSGRRSSGILWTRGDTLPRTGSPDSISTTGERLRWGDRGVGVGHLWEPNEVDQRPSVLPGEGSPPGWLQRGLKNESEVMVVSHHSEKESSEDNESVGPRTYIRGQNIPLDSVIIAERERKRQQAIEHQQAICQQLEERERRRKEEKERRLQEERLEEERIKREQQKERERLFKEEQIFQARVEREKKRQEAMKQAIEDAERAAKLEKQKKKREKMYHNESDESITSARELNCRNMAKYIPSPVQEYPDIVKPLISDLSSQKNCVSESRIESEAETTSTNFKVPPTPQSINESEYVKPRFETEYPKPHIEYPSDSTPQQTPYKPHYPQPPPPNGPTQMGFPSYPDILHQADGLALVLQSQPYDTASLSSLQFAVLMTPQHTGPQVIPLSARSTVATNTVNLTENRVLTPTKYRSLANCRDASTQTEKIEYEIVKKDLKYGSLDRQMNRKHRERRQRSEDRASDRPKWGVNRPPTQYLTQSEKDPLYQRRKLRQKLRELKVDSSDESRSNSPVNTSTKTTPQRTSDRRLVQNLSVYQTEIVPIEADARGRLYVNQKSSQSSRRQSISEKFLIAKQKEQKQQRSNYWVESAEVLTQLSNLKNTLLQKQKNWDNNPALDVMAKLDDLFDKKKETAPILDLSKVTINSKEEFKKVFDKVPEFKTRPEKVRHEELKLRDKDLGFKITKKEMKALHQPYTMLDPTPVDMRVLKLDDLISVPIDWKMLTNIRPKSKIEEEYYSRLIELGKSEVRTINREKREAMMTTTIRRTKNKAGIIETRAISCNECLEEFCTGKYCSIFPYDGHVRVAVPTTTAATGAPTASSSAAAALLARETSKGGKIRRGRKKRKARAKSPKKTVRSKSEGRRVPKKPKHKSGSKSE